MEEDLKLIKQMLPKFEKLDKELSDLDDQLDKIVKKHKDDDKESMIQLFRAMPECHAKFKLFRIMKQQNFL